MPVCIYIRKYVSMVCMYVRMYVCESYVIIVICMYAGFADTADKCRCKTCKEGYILIKGDGALLSQSVVSLAGGNILMQIKILPPDIAPQPLL